LIPRTILGEEYRSLSSSLYSFLHFPINLLAPKFYFAHPVYNMQKYRTKKKVKLLNKRHFEEKEMESVQHFFKKIQYVYFLKKFKKMGI
jgi:hypothetical protein